MRRILKACCLRGGGGVKRAGIRIAYRAWRSPQEPTRRLGAFGDDILSTHRRTVWWDPDSQASFVGSRKLSRSFSKVARSRSK